MTPAARLAAAADILDEVAAGKATEASLTAWARRSRFAGSKDRAAIRDIVFDITRRKLSCAWCGGGETGRHLVIGYLTLTGEKHGFHMTGDGHALQPLTEQEQSTMRDISDAHENVALDIPEWQFPIWNRALGRKLQSVAQCMQARAPVFLRVRSEFEEDVIAEATEADVTLTRHRDVPTAFLAEGNVRRLHTFSSFENGKFEFQDASSQQVIQCLSDQIADADVLDFCAGGGGKSLALMDAGAKSVTAHDINFHRMNDLEARAQRAGVRIDRVKTPSGQFDLVLCDAPCSGSGAWRRQPDGKWRLTESSLSDLLKVQSKILRQAATHVLPEGFLAYVTCSFFEPENEDRVSDFLSLNQSFELVGQHRWYPSEGGDGFFLAIMKRSTR